MLFTFKNLLTQKLLWEEYMKWATTVDIKFVLKDEMRVQSLSSLPLHLFDLIRWHGKTEIEMLNKKVFAKQSDLNWVIEVYRVIDRIRPD